MSELLHRVAIVKGGYSHEANYSSSRFITRAIRELGYEAYELDYCLSSLEEDLTTVRPDVVFPQALGAWGEDGTLQAVLDRLCFKYVGSGILPSAIGMNKYAFGCFVRGLPPSSPRYRVSAPKSFLLLNSTPEPSYEKLADLLGTPFIVKPLSNGASFGVMLIADKATYQCELGPARARYTHLLAEQYISGREFSVGILESDRESVNLPIAEIVADNAELYTQKSKLLGRATHHIPMLDSTFTRELQHIARAIFTALGCRGFARIDLIVKPTEVVVLEINTLPGLIPNISLFPDMCHEAGISYHQMISMLLESARRPHPMMLSRLLETELPLCHLN